MFSAFYFSIAFLTVYLSSVKLLAVRASNIISALTNPDLIKSGNVDLIVYISYIISVLDITCIS
nr:MAG TPA: hypothetical protein [Caudoviricetes sp.]